MQATTQQMSIRDLLAHKDDGMLTANPEYQRGNVWSRLQRQKLVDSVLRGYPIPLIYLHFIEKGRGLLVSRVFEIIDGQQRLEAIQRYVKGEFALLDPIEDDKEARFPSFIKEARCPWGRKRFEDLEDTLQSQLLDTPLAVVQIETSNPNEARDLFIRLQGGLPLTPQEKRDAWPGNFTDFILKVGGKEGLMGYEGHPFFRRVMRVRPNDRGKARQLAAQMGMLLITRRERGEFVGIKSADIDDFYYNHLDFDRKGAHAERFLTILGLLDDLLGDRKRPVVRAHEAIHAMLFVDQLLDGYAPEWKDRFASAFDTFNAELATATRLVKDPNYDPSTPEGLTATLFWGRYGQWIRTNSDQPDRIRTRHEFYVEKMLTLLNPIPKDPKRSFTDAERRAVYFRDGTKCADCGGTVSWDDAEIHHVVEHAKGGRSTLDNAVLMHRECHPKGAAAAEFAKAFDARRSAD